MTSIISLTTDIEIFVILPYINSYFYYFGAIYIRPLYTNTRNNAPIQNNINNNDHNHNNNNNNNDNNNNSNKNT